MNWYTIDGQWASERGLAAVLHSLGFSRIGVLVILRDVENHGRAKIHDGPEFRSSAYTVPRARRRPLLKARAAGGRPTGDSK